MRRLTLLLVACIALPAAAQAGTVLDRVRAEGVLHCGAAIRPGLAFPAPDGTWHGLEVDICRAVAIAVLGPQAKVEFHAYTLQHSSYDPLRRGDDELSFLTASEMLYGGVLPHRAARAAGVLRHRRRDGDGRLARAPRRRPGRQRICAEPGTGPERSLDACFAAHHFELHFSMFQESDEMLDAFYGGRCEAVAHETTSLAAIRLQAEQDGHEARILPEPLAAVPVMAVTPRGDDDWSAIAGWTVQTLIRARRWARRPGRRPEPLPLAGPALGLPKAGRPTCCQAAGTTARSSRATWATDRRSSCRAG